MSKSSSSYDGHWLLWEAIFRVLYGCGVYLPKSEALIAVERGWKMLDPWSN